tara:strand:- start:3670 stop:3849 length:180 start_codon:yes stop_codon:yes gene_type:complete
MGLVKNKNVKSVSTGIDFTKNEIEFILYLIQEGMIPGKRLSEAVSLVEKLQKVYNTIEE